MSDCEVCVSDFFSEGRGNDGDIFYGFSGNGERLWEDESLRASEGFVGDDNFV